MTTIAEQLLADVELELRRDATQMSPSLQLRLLRYLQVTVEREQQGTVRVLRVVEYTGPRAAVERQVERSIHGSRTYGPPGGEVTIRVATVGAYPELLDFKEKTDVHGE